MKKNLTNVLSLLSTPVFFGLHYYTQHPAFLFLFGVLVVLMSAVMALALFCLVYVAIKGEEHEHIRLQEEMYHPPLGRWKLALSITVQILTLTYLLWTSSFILSTLYIIMIVLSYLIIAFTPGANEMFGVKNDKE